MVRTCVPLSLALVCLWAAGPHASQPPVFRSGVDLLTVETLVVDGDGHPVTGLSREDFVVTVDGAPRSIESFQFVASPEPPRDAELRPPDVSTNEADVPGRLVLLVVDRINIRRGDGGPVLDALGALVRRLGPQDRVGLYTLPGGGPQVELTADRGAVLAALPRIRGVEERQIDPLVTITIAESYRIDRGVPGVLAEVVERNCIGIGTVRPQEEGERATAVEFCAKQVEGEARRMVREMRMRNEETMRRLESLLESLRYIEGPKALVYVSDGLPLDVELRARLRTFGSRVAAASTSFFAIQLYQAPMDVTSSGLRPDWDEDRTFRAEGLSYLTGVSGGALFRPAAGLGTVPERIARELSARYLLGVPATAVDRDGRPHRIEVKLRHERDRTIRHRTEFTLDPVTRRFGRTIETLAGALAEPLPLAALPLRVGTHVVPESASVYKVILAADVGPATDKPVPAQVAFEVYDVDGRKIGQSEEAVPLPDEGAGPQPLRYTAAVRLPPGRFRLKLAAKDATGRIGSIEHPFFVDGAGTIDVALGSLMLFRSVGEGPATRPEIVFDLSTRETGFGAHLIAHAGTPAALDELTAVLEVSDVRQQVSRFNRTMTAQPGASPALRGFEAAIPTKHWPPGDYSAQVTVLRGGQPIATITRALTLRDVGGPVEEGSEASTAPPARLGALIGRATAYVAGYAERVSSAVAEERYVQAILDEVAGRPLSKRDEVLTWREDQSRARDKSQGVSARRQLRSDLLMVKTSTGWYTNYRDVAEVDGKPVRERDARALSLFTGDAAANGATLKRVALEGARHNLGTLRRTINVPTLPLFAVHPQHVKRFSFEPAGEDVVDGVPVTIVGFRERHIPTFIQNARGDDVFTSGRLWIAADGRVLKTALAVDERSSGLQVTIDVAYRDVPNLGLLMPAEMHERYKVPSDPNRVLEGRAVYSNFRRFTVTTAEER